MKRMEFLRTRKSAVVTIACVVLICLIVVLIVHIVNKPVSARIITTDTPPAAQAPSLPKLITVNNAYVSFSYPESMHPNPDTQAPSAPILAVYNYLKTDILTWQLSVTVTQLRSPSLDYDSGYEMRKDNPAEYQASTVTYGNNTFTIMNDTDAQGFGEVAYILHGDTDATIALVGEDATGTSELDTTFQQVLQSLQWH